MKRQIWTLMALVLSATSAFSQQEIPKVSDPRLIVELFASSPDIVHPIACDFDHKGRLLVIESHTHFAPQGYKGPKFDRIQAFDVSKPGTKPTTFFEGTRHTMDLAVHPDGSVYIATRNEILRLRDTKGAGVADEKTRIVFLDTKGDYPHNGLSGLCFDSKGDLTFGMGENLGAKYTLIGSDCAKFSGEGDGGHIFHCTADGKKLHRIATGFWNPFGNCRDIYGRLFCVDNDPDQAPPCRMVHVVEGGDYGFTFRYGRSGKHPFQSWHGTLPGTLPMMTGVGEAPCEILSYESDGLPAEYRGQLLVTSWADHRVERYAVKPHGASFKADRLPFVQGGNNFRPTGMCVAPDGSLFVADWVLSNYTLHGKGAIWHIRLKDSQASRERKRPEDPREAIFSMHRPLREAAAKKLAGDEKGREFLRNNTKSLADRVRAASLTALIDVGDERIDLKKIVETDSSLGVQELAIRAVLAIHAMDGKKLFELRKFIDQKYPGSVRIEAMRVLKFFEGRNDRLVELLSDSDPFLRHRATHELYENLDILLTIDPTKLRDPRQRIGVLIARQTMSDVFSKDGPSGLEPFLTDPDDEVRFLAAKWIADKKVSRHRKDIEKGMQDPKLSVRLYMAYATALARLDGQEVSETRLADYFAKRLADDSTPPALRALLLRQVPATHPKLTVDLLTKLLKSDDAALKMEAVRALVEHPNGKRNIPLLEVFRDPKAATSLRAYAMLGLTDRVQDFADEIYDIAKTRESPLRVEALRALIGVKLKKGQLDELAIMERGLQSDDDPRWSIRRLIYAQADLDKRPYEKASMDRPPAKDLDAWLKRLEGKADADAGARIFFHPKLGGCYKCHRVDGRGQDVGPDLSNIGNTDRRHLLESILQPSNNVAPHYVAWHLETADGKVRNGMLLHTNLDEYTYLDAKGDRFKVRTSDLVEQRPLTVSIMPDGLVDRMTDQEIRDLLAYLQTRK